MLARTSTVLAALWLAACAGPGSATASGWTDLFDGTSLDGWHGYASADVPAAWTVQDGVLALSHETGEGGDLVAPGTYGDFELEVVWKIAECGNSGILYRGEEAAELAPIYRTALEMQVLDNCHSDGRYPSHRNGALYDLYTPAEDASRPGDWNTSRIVARGPHIEHWLNGRKIVEAEQGSDDWASRLSVSKFRDGEAFPAYGTRRAGLIGLQDHGDDLWVRSVRVRSL